VDSNFTCLSLIRLRPVLQYLRLTAGVSATCNPVPLIVHDQRRSTAHRPGEGALSAMQTSIPDGRHQNSQHFGDSSDPGLCDVRVSTQNNSKPTMQQDISFGNSTGSDLASVESFVSWPVNSTATSHVNGNQAAVSRPADLGRQDAWGGTATRIA